MTGLSIKRLDGESWREATARIARQHGLEQEVLEAYDGYIRAGSAEDEAAWCACYDWDVCEWVS